MLSDQLSNRIGNLKVYSQRGYSPALRMHISNTVSSLDMHPTGMPPSAIFLVGKIVEKMPGDTASLQHNFKQRNRWVSNLRSQLDDVYKHAIRPSNGQVSAHAKAIVFSDQSEMMACLCRDIVEGNVNNKWWWKRIYAPVFNASSLSSSIRSSLLETQGIIPVVFDFLAQWRRAVSLVKLLDREDTEALINAVLEDFACTSLSNKLADSQYQELSRDTINYLKNQIISPRSDQKNYSAPVNLQDALPHSSRLKYQEDNRFYRKPPDYPPWFSMFSDQIWESGLTKSQACLLGITRLAHSTPMLLRNRVFEDQIVNWWRETKSPDPTIDKHEEYGDIHDIELSSQQGEPSDLFSNERPSLIEENKCSNEFVDETEIQTNVREIKTKVSRERINYCEAETTNEIYGEISERDRKNEVAIETSNNDSESESKNDIAFVLEKERNSFNNTAEVVDSYNPYTENKNPHGDLIPEVTNNEVTQADDYENEFDDELWLTENFIDTDLGGCLFLINLLDQLELPENMNAKWEFDRHLSRWAFLEFISLLLLGEQESIYINDPLWKLLALLDQRKSKSLIGDKYLSNSAAVADYYLPVDWWRYICTHDNSQEKHLLWAVHKNRLRIWSRSYILVDRFLKSSDLSEDIPQATLQMYMKEYEIDEFSEGVFDESALENISEQISKKISGPLVRWASFTLPFLRLFLKNQLSLNSTDIQELMQILLCLPGRIYLTSSHIDLVANVNLTSLNIRRSGLDQNPGWLPLYGRVVLFHFIQT